MSVSTRVRQSEKTQITRVNNEMSDTSPNMRKTYNVSSQGF